MCMLRACVCYVEHFGVLLYLVLAAGCGCHDRVAKGWSDLFRNDIDQLHKSKSTENINDVAETVFQIYLPIKCNEFEKCFV